MRKLTLAMFQLIVYQRMGEEVIGNWNRETKEIKKSVLFKFDPDKVFSDLCAMGGRIVFPIASLSFFQFKMLDNFC